MGDTKVGWIVLLTGRSTNMTHHKPALAHVKKRTILCQQTQSIQPFIAWTAVFFRCVLTPQQEGLCVRQFVHSSDGPLKSRFSAVLVHGEIVFRRSIRLFWEAPLTLTSNFPAVVCLSVHPSLCPCVTHNQREFHSGLKTHRCPVGLVISFSASRHLLWREWFSSFTD